MLRVVLVLSVCLVVAVAGWANARVADAGELREKVVICHLTSSATNPVVIIEVSASAVPAHIRHGDVITGGKGACDEKRTVNVLGITPPDTGFGPAEDGRGPSTAFALAGALLAVTGAGFAFTGLRRARVR
jgi:hypothetical protein